MQIENTWWGKTPGFCYVLTAVAGQSECKLLRKDSTIYRAPCVTPIHEASAFGESCRLSVCGILVYYEVTTYNATTNKIIIILRT